MKVYHVGDKVRFRPELLCCYRANNDDWDPPHAKLGGLLVFP
jgi:hypothetical protein